MTLVLRAKLIQLVADAKPDVRWMGSWLEITDAADPALVLERGRCVPRFEMMCEAIMNDIQSAEGSSRLPGRHSPHRIRRSRPHRGHGNAWVAYITRDKVWFEGLYSQGEGGQVSFEQYKLAVQTYVRFLADPQRRPIEVEFPDQ
ncbi:MAG: hypothetical protein AB1666_09330 [Pseudomonadota bacterium]